MIKPTEKHSISEPALKVLMVASEAAPFAKTGGLADVVGSLPPALYALGHDVRLIMPWYRSVRQVTGELPATPFKLTDPVGQTVRQASYRSGSHRGVPVYFIEAPEFYDRPGLYGEAGTDYPDNAERFGLLCRAALELTRQLGFAPDVIHAHDWQAALAPVFLQQRRGREAFFAATCSLFSIHNLGYQGIFPLASAATLGLDQAMLTADGLEYHGKISLLKGGIRYADQINTVSPTYCREIQTAEQGMGLDGLLRSRGESLHGLLNGLDGSLWSPADDRTLPRTYTVTHPDGKTDCKQALQRELGLQEAPTTPLVAMVTRLDPQKGIDLLLESWDRILRRNLQLVILGSGQPDLERRLAAAAAYYPGQASVQLGFDDALSRRIYAGSDLFLMPSRYEPCGLGQLIALRYGSVPLVHATGGLVDTIIDPRVSAERANGFVFQPYRHESLLQGLDRALAAYGEPAGWQRLVQRGMSQDLSWSRAASQYVDLYRLCTKGLP